MHWQRTSSLSTEGERWSITKGGELAVSDQDAIGLAGIHLQSESVYVCVEGGWGGVG